MTLRVKTTGGGTFAGSAALGLLAAGLVAGTALAYEPGVHEATRTGVTLGAPVGALPPPGVYMNINYLRYEADVVDKHGDKTGFHDVVASPSAQLLFVPGWQFLGASFGAYVVVPMIYNDTEFEKVAGPCTTPNCTVRDVFGFHNTLFSPINLSWNLGGGWFTSAGFGFYAPNGTVKNAQMLLPPAGTGAPGLDYWTFQPSWAVSYLSQDWALTAHLYYEFNTKNEHSQYTSGDVLYGDFTFLKKVGNWEFGPVASFIYQTTEDKDPLGVYSGPQYDPINDRRSQQIAVGGMIGYDFGVAKVNLIVTDDVYARNTGSGWQVMTNMSFRLWGPDAPAAKPIIRK
jgi:hypothetical protein